MSNDKLINRRTFKEVVIKQLYELSGRLDLQIKGNLARADYHKKNGFNTLAARFENLANGLIDARHEVLIMAMDIEQGGDL